MGKQILNGVEYSGSNQSGSSWHDYSTTEQVVGTWIDGKPLYEQTFNLSSEITIQANSWATTSVSNADKKAIINCIGFNSGGTFFGQLMASVDGDPNYVMIGNARPSTAIGIICFVLQYTKTTD